MTASITEDHLIETIPPVQDGKGTIVMSEGLFENFPARRNFLKRPSSETMMCREVFIEKSLPRPDIAFRLTVDGTIRHDLPAKVTLAERFARALELKESTNLFAEIKSSGKENDGTTDWSYSLVIGEPSIYRNDRKQIYIFVNGRRVQEYSLMQAIEYGCQGFFPNGTHPVAALFLNVSPRLVDFNIHPAKKEVRFKDISSVHHGVSSGVRNYFRSYGIKSSFEREQEIQEELAKNERNSLFQAIVDNELSRAEKDYRVKPDNDRQGTHVYDRQSIHNYNRQGTHAHDRQGRPTQDSSVIPALDTLITPAQDASVIPAQDASVIPAQESPVIPALDAGIYNIEHTKNYEPESTQTYSSRLADYALSEAKVASPAPESPVSDSFAKNHIRFQNGNEMRFSIPGSSVSSRAEPDFVYYGTLFGTFLMVQKNGVFYLIDQHAAHERILFNKLMAGGSETQELLVPYEIQTDSKEDDDYLSSIQATLSTAGFKCENKGNGKWIFTSLPARYKGSQADLKAALFEKHVSPEEIIYQIAAMTACKAAVKDGTILGPGAAENLAREALELKDPHCPHGRPCWTTLTKEELFARVRRTR